MSRAAVLALLLLAACSTPPPLRREDGKSIAVGDDILYGYSVPPLPEGVPLSRARPGSTLVLWNGKGFEALLKIGDPCRIVAGLGPADMSGNRLGGLLLAKIVLEPYFPQFKIDDTLFLRNPDPKLPSDPADADGLMPSDALKAVLESGRALRCALDNVPPQFMKSGGRVRVLARLAVDAPAKDLAEIAAAATREAYSRDARVVAEACLARAELGPEPLKALFRGLAARSDRDELRGVLESVLRHPSADAALLDLALADLGRRDLPSSARRELAVAVAKSPALTPGIRAKLESLDFEYAEDREAVRAALR